MLMLWLSRCKQYSVQWLSTSNWCFFDHLHSINEVTMCSSLFHIDPKLMLTHTRINNSGAIVNSTTIILLPCKPVNVRQGKRLTRIDNVIGAILMNITLHTFPTRMWFTSDILPSRVPHLTYYTVVLAPSTSVTCLTPHTYTTISQSSPLSSTCLTPLLHLTVSITLTPASSQCLQEWRHNRSVAGKCYVCLFTQQVSSTHLYTFFPSNSNNKIQRYCRLYTCKYDCIRWHQACVV